MQYPVEKFKEIRKGSINISTIKNEFKGKLKKISNNTQNGGCIIFENGLQDEWTEETLIKAVKLYGEKEIEEDIIKFYSTLPDTIEFTVKDYYFNLDRIMMIELNQLPRKSIIDLAFFMAYELRQPLHQIPASGHIHQSLRDRDH